jgi:hypothetical protein
LLPLKWLLVKSMFCFLIILSFQAHAQETKNNILFVQFGFGKTVSTGPPATFNLSWHYEGILLNEGRWRIGVQPAFGLWTNGDLYADSNVSGTQFVLVATVKYGLGTSLRQNLCVDGGASLFNVSRIDPLAEPVKKQYLLFTGAFSYQYFGSKSFYGRIGISLRQGLFIGLGAKF